MDSCLRPSSDTRLSPLSSLSLLDSLTLSRYVDAGYELDAQGVPVKKVGGDNISPQEMKKIQKAIENQRKKHEEYLKKCVPVLTRRRFSADADTQLTQSSSMSE